MTHAERFYGLLAGGKIKKDTLPNNSPDYTGGQETLDLESYRSFANSFALDEIMECEVEPYNGDEQC